MTLIALEEHLQTNNVCLLIYLFGLFYNSLNLFVYSLIFKQKQVVKIVNRMDCNDIQANTNSPALELCISL